MTKATHDFSSRLSSNHMAKATTTTSAAGSAAITWLRPRLRLHQQQNTWLRPRLWLQQHVAKVWKTVGGGEANAQRGERVKP